MRFVFSLQAVLNLEPPYSWGKCVRPECTTHDLHMMMRGRGRMALETNAWNLKTKIGQESVLGALALQCVVIW